MHVSVSACMHTGTGFVCRRCPLVFCLVFRVLRPCQSDLGFAPISALSSVSSVSVQSQDY